MHVLYIAIWARCSKELGTVKKVMSQIKFLKNQGLKVHALFFYQSIQLETFDEVDDIEFIKYVNYTSFNKTHQRIFLKVQQYCNKVKHDIIYFRYPLSSRYLLEFVRKNPNKVILEHQAKEVNELFLMYRQSMIRLQQLLSEIIFAPLVLRYTLGSVGVTDEITRYERKRAFLNKRLITKTISNGINVDEIPVKKKKEIKQPIINLIFVGEYGPWHGLERIVDGISRYNGKTRFKVYVVGSLDLLKDIRKKVEKLNLQSAFVFMGRKVGEELDAIFDSCNMAIGSLALHRNKLVEASTLKTREYISRGIPFIIGYLDTDLKHSKVMSQFHLKVKATEEPINMNEVIRFLKQVQKVPNHPEQMRAFAEKNLDMEVKMKQLAKFIIESHKNQNHKKT